MDFNSIISELTSGQVGGAALIGLVGFMILGAVKGLMRVILGIAGFVAAVVAFWFSFRHGDTIIAKFTDSPEPWMPLGVAGASGVGAYTMVRHGIGIIFRPLIGSLDALKKHRVLSGVAGLGLGGAGLFGGSTAMQQFDAMKVLDTVKESHQEVTQSGIVQSLIIKLQESWIGKVQEVIDPTQNAERCTLIKALGIYTAGQSHLYQKPELQPLIQNHGFLRLASSPEIARKIGSQDVQSLLRDPNIDAFLKDGANRAILKAIDWTKVQ